MDCGGQEDIPEWPSWSGGQDDKTWTTILDNGDAPPEAASGGKSKMPHEMLQRDSESRSSGSRFWWNLEITYLQIATPGIEPGASNG